MVDLNKKILIVEDDEDFLFILKTSFDQEGFSVVTAKDAGEGLSLVKKEKPNLIIIDILLPGMDGIEMAKKMKEMDIKSPMIFLTNLSDADYISKALEIGLSDYIVKSDARIEDIIARVKKKLGIN